MMLNAKTANGRMIFSGSWIVGRPKAKDNNAKKIWKVWKISLWNAKIIQASMTRKMTVSQIFLFLETDSSNMITRLYLYSRQIALLLKGV